jgi:hypothetical protein
VSKINNLSDIVLIVLNLLISFLNEKSLSHKEARKAFSYLNAL